MRYGIWSLMICSAPLLPNPSWHTLMNTSVTDFNQLENKKEKISFLKKTAVFKVFAEYTMQWFVSIILKKRANIRCSNIGPNSIRSDSPPYWCQNIDCSLCRPTKKCRRSELLKIWHAKSGKTLPCKRFKLKSPRLPWSCKKYNSGTNDIECKLRGREHCAFS